MREQFAIALSEKNNEEGIKEASLKIKAFLPKLIKYALVFFTPHYQPLTILKTADLLLRPGLILGIQAPSLIFEERIIEKGIILCCINKDEAQLKEIFIKSKQAQNIESSLDASLRENARKKFLLSFVSHQFNSWDYLRGVELSLGKIFNIWGAGFTKRYASKNYQIINKSIDEGLVNIAGEGVEIDSLRIGGFLPLGKPFIITKAISKTGVIMEIDGQPAVNIYRNYLQEKFEIFKKNYLFPFYPLGIRTNGQTRLISIVNCLEDGSLVSIGKIKKDLEAHIMLLNPLSLFESLKVELEPIKKNKEGLVFIINSLIRKKILKDYAEEETKLIKQYLGEKFKTIGIYSDYSFFPDKELREISMETSSLLLTLWR